MTDRYELDLSAWNNEGNNARIDEFWKFMKAAKPAATPAPMTELIDAQIQRDAEAPGDTAEGDEQAKGGLGAFDAWRPDHKLQSRRAAELLEAHADADLADMQAEFERDLDRVAAGFDAAHSVVERVVARVQS